MTVFIFKSFDVGKLGKYAYLKHNPDYQKEHKKTRTTLDMGTPCIFVLQNNQQNLFAQDVIYYYLEERHHVLLETGLTRQLLYI